MELFCYLDVLSCVYVLHDVKRDVKYYHVAIHFHPKDFSYHLFNSITKQNTNDLLVSTSVPFSSLTIIFENIFSINYLHFSISEVLRVFAIVANKTRAISFLLCPSAASCSVHIMYTVTELLANRVFGKQQWILREAVPCASSLIN